MPSGLLYARCSTHGPNLMISQDEGRFLPPRRPRHFKLLRPSHYFQSSTSPSFSSYLASFGSGGIFPQLSDSFPFLCLLNEESFHYPPPMDPLRPGLATDSQLNTVLTLNEVLVERRITYPCSSAFLHPSTPVITIAWKSNEGKKLFRPDLAPSDYHLFLTMKWLFADDEELKNAVAHWFKSQAAAFYAKEIDKLVKRHEKCLKNEADYAEK
ncbi:mariner Mos1 transposase [Trichonephila clavipes]|nr:mariner Mos1 transposase [Trichonephila clavipes]